MAAVSKQVSSVSNGTGSTRSFSYSSKTSSSRQLSVQKVTFLREITNKVTASCRRELGASSTQLLESATEIGVLLDFIVGERLRCMPHPGSKYDKVLRWAEYFAMQTSAFSEAVSEVVMYSSEAAQLIWGSCLLLLQLGEDNLDLLDKLFGVFYKLGLSVQVFIHHGDLLLESPSAQKACGKAFASLLQVVTNSSIYYSKKASNGSAQVKAGEFEELFGRVVEAFHHEITISSTAMWSSSVEDISSSDTFYDVEAVRRFLAPQDRVTRALMSGRISSRHHRAEYTCEWATKRLTDFARSKDDVVLITGKEYSGKSVLAGWIADRMRNTKGRLGHDIISYDIDSALKEQTSSMAVIQGLVLQVFDKFVGDLSLYKALCASLRASIEGKPLAQVEDTLWSALEVALAKAGQLMIIVDGIDQLGETAMVHYLEKLHKVASKHEKVKAVVLSRPLTKVAPKNIKLWTIEPEGTKQDIAHFTHERLTSSVALRSLSHEQRHSIVEKVSNSANGSFAWADIAIEIIKTEKTISGITKLLESLPKNLKEAINRLMATVDISSKDSRSVLAWMLAAQRPLLLTEIKQLFEIDFANMTYSQRFTNIEQDVRKACGGLVDITDGIVRFRSLAIRTHFLDLAANVKDFSNSDKNVFPFHIQEASYDLCLRSLLFVKLVVDRQLHVSTVPLNYDQLTELFDEHTFLEYASRYWLIHFRNSPMHKYPGEHKLTAGFKSAFPATVAHSLIEGSCIRAQYPLTEVYDLFLLSLTLRKSVLGDSTEPILQTLINVATIRQHLNIKETNIYFYQAFKLSQTILGHDSEITITCAQKFVDSITTFTTRSTETEEVLSYIIEIQRKTLGVTDETTVTNIRRLAEYYVVIKEETKAATLYREVYEILVSRYGRHHTETEEIFHRLKKVSKQEDLQHITREQHKFIEEDLNVSDIRREHTTRDLVQHYEKENNFEKAEETMVNYWREISEASRTSKDVKLQEQQVNATFEYVRFLQRHKRTEEATTILNGLYLELEKNTTLTQSKVSWIQQIGEQMKTMGSNSSACKVFSSLWSYYRTSGQQNTKEAQAVAQLLTETVTSSVTYTTTIESQEILTEILETTTMSSTATVDSTTIKTCQQLITVYLRQEKHEEIIEVCRDVLQRLWPTVLTGQKDVKMPKEFETEAVDIANHLARSYFVLHYVEESTQVYFSIFQGFRSSPKRYTKELLSSAQHLISHYQSIYRHKDALYLYEALYEALVEVYGPKHQKVIDLLYEKADLELKHNRRKEAQASYLQIYTTLKDKSDHCPKEGIRAALALCQMYEKEQKWESAREIYSILWTTFLHKGKDFDLGVDFVNQIFDRYLYIVENKTSSDYATVRGIASQYRETCIKFYGPDSERTLTATMRLANLDEKDEKYKDEAVSLYEFVISTFRSSKKTSTAATFTPVTTARQRLAHLYSARNITHERAQNLYQEEFETMKNKQGLSHKDTLFWLSLLITCYKKRNTAESNKAASVKLQEVAAEIIINEKDTNKLYESSQSIANIYKSQNVAEPSAQEFLTELRRHVITGESNITALKGKTTDRRSYTFVVGFEEAISGSQFSVIMSELMSESLLSEAYLKARKGDASFDVVFGYGARLYSFLKSRQRNYSRVEEELLEVFTHKIVGNRQVEKTAVRQFFDVVLTEHGKDQQDVIVLKTISEAILRAFNESQFQRGYSLAVLSDAYMHHYDGFRSQSKIEIAFKICLYLTGREAKKTPDVKLHQKMLQLSHVLLKEVLQAAKAIHLHLIALPLEQLSSLVALLGEQKNYEDLEWILHDLWSSRHTQTSWPPSNIVSIGRKLIECRFSMGHRGAAIHLAEDICYNLRKVWGPLDKTTLELSSLLAEMYTAIGQHSKAMGVHEEILNQIISDEIDLDQVTSTEEADIAVRHLDLLHRSFARNGGQFPTDKDPKTYNELYSALKETVGGEKSWQSAGAITEGFEKWAASAKSWKGDEADGGLGTWHDVSSWEILSEGEKKRKHINALRRASARLSGDFGKSYTNGFGVNGHGLSVNGNGSNVHRNGISANGNGHGA